MHISEGLLPAPLWLGGYGLTALFTGYSLGRLQRLERDPRRQLPKAALLTAAFFVTSSIHLPFPPASLHLLLNGLMGVLLGALAYPAIVVGLFFQAVAFGHGGLTTLGINAAILGIPALLAGGIFRAGRRLMGAGLSAFLAGAAGVGLAALLFYGVVMAALRSEGIPPTSAERLALAGLVAAHLPLAGVEGLFTRWVVLFLQRVRPELVEENDKR